MENYIGNKYNRWTILEYVGAIKYRKSFLCICECGVQRVVSFSNLKNSKSKSCGCLRNDIVSSNNKIRVVLNHDKYLAISCNNCGCNFNRLKSNLKESNHFYCSVKCRAQHQKEFIKGENHPLWVDDRSELIDRRACPETKEWRSKIFTRDNYKCQICNLGGSIHGHHLKSFTRFPELRFDLDNGVTLCRICHENFHSKYGTKNFTSDDYYEFKREREVEDGR